MDLSRWFSAQLESSAEGFAWAVDQAPAARRHAAPPGPAGGLGAWSVARHAFHLVSYERRLALPAMRHWLGGPLPSFDAYDEDGSWAGAPDLSTILRDFRAVRRDQTAQLPHIDEALWHGVRETGWGAVTLRWIVSKTYQHTAEHTSDVLRIALFWDRIAQGIRRREEEQN